jgi:hypothetical protein
MKWQYLYSPNIQSKFIKKDGLPLIGFEQSNYIT